MRFGGGSAHKIGSRREGIPLRKVVSVHSPPYASTNVEHDALVATLRGYIPGSGTLDTVRRLGIGMRGGKRGRTISVTGPYGSGKSTMAVFLDGLAAPMASAEWKSAHATLRRADPELASSFKKTRTKLGAHKTGLIRCFVTSRREPVAATILRALHAGASKYFGKYNAKSFEGAGKLAASLRRLKHSSAPDARSIIDVVEGLCAKAPVLVVVDEFGKNIEHFASEGTQESDLFLLQELAEMSGASRKVPLFMVTLQHMAFEEYAAGTSISQRREWSKIQGRFDDILFANSPEQTRLLVTSVLKPAYGYRKAAEGSGKRQTRKKDDAPAHRRWRAVESWARSQARKADRMGLGGDLNRDLLLSCYPLHPLALEVLPELCSRYGQYERTLLSFLADGGPNTVARFVSENEWDGKSANLPTVGLDTLYDYFVSGSSMTRASSSNVSRLIEIETLVRDTRGLTPEEERVLKAVAVLNLVGRSGKLRASTGMIGYAIGTDPGPALKELERRSITTYRRHSAEHRIWHGTDVDIQAKLEVARRKLANASLTDMLGSVMALDPVVAAKHAIEMGTMRVFERRFSDPDDGAYAEPSDGYDGAITYVMGRVPGAQDATVRPVIAAGAGNLKPLHKAVIEAASIRDVLAGSPEIDADWVARRELNERLAEAEASVEREFEAAFRDSAWLLSGSEGALAESSTTSAVASEACDAAYPGTPRVFNEMVNRNALSAQGATAVNRLLSAMIEHPAKNGLGIEGWGPERAMYEAVLVKTGIHCSQQLEAAGFGTPNDMIAPLWNMMEGALRGCSGRVPVSQIYRKAKLPPFGAKDGILPVLLTAMIVSNRDSIAVYEHGTYRPAINPPLAERLAKNPAHFELKYFARTKDRDYLLAGVAAGMEIRPSGGAANASLLDIVSELVRTVRFLPPHILNTKTLDRDATAVRDTVSTAIEPDTLLFESLPMALGFVSFMKTATHRDADAFAKRLTAGVKSLRSALNRLLADLRSSLFEATGIQNRRDLAKASSAILDNVEDQQMKVFLTAVSNDALEDDNDWANYVALSLTKIPPAEWSDEQRSMFYNNLRDACGRFARLASVRFVDVSDSFAKPSHQITVTNADGSEHRSIVSLRPEQKTRVERVAARAIIELKKAGLTSNDVDALIAALIDNARKE